MIKTINISGNDYVMKTSAYTRFKYKNDFNRELLDDIKQIQNVYKDISSVKKEEQANALFDKLPTIMDTTLMIAYTMISEYDATFKPYTEWLKELDNLMDKVDWVNEVLTFSMSTFRGRV